MSPSYGILAESNSDISTLKVLIRRLADAPNLTIKGVAYNGCSRLVHKGAKQLALFAALRFDRFIICHDADGPDPAPLRKVLHERIVVESGYAQRSCLVIPVQELEAWILADIEAVSRVFSGWNPGPIHSPEKIPRPKEHIERLSRAANGKPRYAHATHNARVAEHLNLSSVSQKCESFRELENFVASPGDGRIVS